VASDQVRVTGRLTMRLLGALADTDPAVVTEPVLLQPVQQPEEGGLVPRRQDGLGIAEARRAPARPGVPNW